MGCLNTEEIIAGRRQFLDTLAESASASLAERRKNDTIPYKYDEGMGLICKIVGEYEGKNTYIAKADGQDDIYKIGKSSHLPDRFKALKSSGYYGFKFSPFAYCLKDFEAEILWYCNNLLVDGKEELVRLSSDEVEFLINEYGFIRIDGSPVPTARNLLQIDYYNKDGRFDHSETKETLLYDKDN